MKRHYVLKDKKRFFSLVILTAVILSSIFFASSVYGYEIKQYDSVMVERGDSLWSIAREYNKRGDIRKLIAEIKKINNLNSSNIYEGDVLLVPQLQ